MHDSTSPSFERAAVRWIIRFAGRCPVVGLGEVQAAVEALPPRDAVATWTALLRRPGHDRSCDVSRQFAEKAPAACVPWHCQRLSATAVR
jgi:hypothetical protein